MSQQNQATNAQKEQLHESAGQVVDTLKEQLRADASILPILKDKVIAACSGDKRAKQWLQTPAGSNWLTAAGQYLEEGGKIPYP